MSASSRRPLVARRRAGTLAAVATLALAGCGGGDDGSSTAPGGSTNPEGPGGDRSRALVVAVCQSTTRDVPAVPDEGAGAAERRTYLRAVERAMRTLAPDLERLATQDAGRRVALTAIARRMRAVETVARRTAAAQVPAGNENDLATTLARLNVLATRERLPQCGV